MSDFLLFLLQAEDVGALKWQAAELASRLEMMQAQLSKAGLAAERAEEDKGNLEQELASALAAATTPPDQTVGAPRSCRCSH